MSDLVDIARSEIDDGLHRKIDCLRQKVRRAKISSPVCTVCGEIISTARQQAAPGCRLCFDCQKEREKNSDK